jgi:hypothetical protein
VKIVVQIYRKKQIISLIKAYSTYFILQRVGIRSNKMISERLRKLQYLNGVVA